MEIAAVVAGILALNVAAAVVYKLKFKAAPPPPPVAVVPPSPVPDQDQEKFRAFRGAGLTALSQGNYEMAVEQFTQALRFGKADSDIMELLKMAKEFQDKQRDDAKVDEPEVAVAVAPTRKPEPPPTPRPQPKAPVKREPPRPVARVEPKEREKEPKEEPVAAAPQPATLLITSAPTGLVVEVDGARKDLTPAKVSVGPGTHVVSLWKGEARLFQKTVTAEAGQVSLIDAELTAQLAAAEPARAQPVAPIEKAPTPEKPAEKVKAPEPPPPTPLAPTSPVAELTGELQIQSLNVYGEVFVNGKSVGFPPVVAKGIPAAQATIEVKVDGSVRRKRLVDVVANKRTTVRIP